MSAMNLPAIGPIDALGTLFVLLPGLVTFLVVRYLTTRERKIEATDAILQGLAYTLLANALWAAAKLFGSLIPTPDIVGLPLSGLLLGLMVAWLVNQDFIFSLLRKIGITNEASWSTIWESTLRDFKKLHGTYVVITLDDGRRVQGWLVGFSSEQKDGHVCLQNIQWIDVEHATELKGLHLFNAMNVQHVHLMF
jgi:Family of unknown function (DUF6338)